MSIPTAYVGDCYSTVTPPLLDYQTLASGVWKSARMAGRRVSLARKKGGDSRRSLKNRRNDREIFYYCTDVRRRPAVFSVRAGRAAIFESHLASSGRRSRLAGIYGGLQPERCLGWKNQGVNRPRRPRANSLRLLRLRPYGGGQTCWGDGGSDQGGYRRVGVGAQDEHRVEWQSVRHGRI